MIGDIRKLLLLPHVAVHSANAISSPFTIGFPAMTAWLGAMHALERKLKADGFSSLVFRGMAVVSHKADLQVSKGDYVYSIIGTANPLEKDGGRSAFIEEARIHLDVSLLIEHAGVDKDEEEKFLQRISHHLHGSMKLAGGDIMDFNPPLLFRIEEGNEKDWGAVRRRLMPGYAIVERRELMAEAMENGADAIDALLEYLAVHHQCEVAGDEVLWTSKRKTPGWIVPIAIGFQGISELGAAKNQRDADTPHRFAESVITLGEFKMPYKISLIDEMLWRYHTDKDKNLYLCQQVNTLVPSAAH